MLSCSSNLAQHIWMADLALSVAKAATCRNFSLPQLGTLNDVLAEFSVCCQHKMSMCLRTATAMCKQQVHLVMHQPLSAWAAGSGLDKVCCGKPKQPGHTGSVWHDRRGTSLASVSHPHVRKIFGVTSKLGGSSLDALTLSSLATYEAHCLYTIV